MNQQYLTKILTFLQESREMEYIIDEIQAILAFEAYDEISEELDNLRRIAVKMELLERELHYIYQMKGAAQ